VAVADDLRTTELRQNEQQKAYGESASCTETKGHKLGPREAKEHGVPEQGHEHQTKRTTDRKDGVHRNGACE